MVDRTSANQILGALLEHLRATGGQAFFQSLSHQNRYFRDTTETRFRRQLVSELGIRDRELATHFLAALDLEKQFGDVFDLPNNAAVLDDKELDELLIPEGDLVPTWPKLKRRFPATRGIIALGIPILNDKLDTAVMYVGQTFAPKMGHGRMHVFHQNNDVWKIDTDQVLGIWVS